MGRFSIRRHAGHHYIHIYVYIYIHIYISLLFWWGGWVPMPTHTHPYPSIPIHTPSIPIQWGFRKPQRPAIFEARSRCCSTSGAFGSVANSLWWTGALRPGGRCEPRPRRNHWDPLGMFSNGKPLMLNHLNPYWSIIVLHFYMTNNLGLGTRVHCMMFCTFSVLHGADHADRIPSDSCGILQPQGLKLASDSEMEFFDQLSPRSQRRWAFFVVVLWLCYWMGCYWEAASKTEDKLRRSWRCRSKTYSSQDLQVG